MTREALLALRLGAGVAALHHLPQAGAAQLGLEVPVRRGRRDALLTNPLEARLAGGVEVLDQARAQVLELLRGLLRAPELGEVLFDDLLQRPSPWTASLVGVSPLKTSNVKPIVPDSRRVSASTSATSSRGTEPRRPSVVETSTRPVPGPSSRLPGRTIVQSSVLATTRASASAFARRYGRIDSGPASGSWAPIEDTITNRATPSCSAASTHLTAAPKSTVRLRSAPEPGPAPAANTIASAPSTCGASSSRSRSQSTGTPPSASMSAAWSSLRISPRAVWPSPASSRISRRAIFPCPPAIRTSIGRTVAARIASHGAASPKPGCRLTDDVEAQQPRQRSHARGQRIRATAGLLGRLLADQRATDQGCPGDSQRLRRHAPRRRIDEREPRDGVAAVERQRRERATQQVRRADAIAGVAERRPRREPGQPDDRRPVHGGDVDRAAPGVLDPPPGELREEAQQVVADLRDHLVVDLHPPAGARAGRHPAAGPAEHDPPVARRARVVQQRASVGDCLAAVPAEPLDHVRDRLGADDVARGHREPVAQRREHVSF